MDSSITFHHRVAPHLGQLDSLLDRLLRCEPMQVNRLPKWVAGPGIYVFTESQLHVYVGRTNDLRKRLQQHQRNGSQHNAAPFAFRLARESTGLQRATYRTEGSRAQIGSDPRFVEAFSAAKARIRQMDVRAVRVDDPVTQALFEVYASVAVDARYNTFDNH